MLFRGGEALKSILLRLEQLEARHRAAPKFFSFTDLFGNERRMSAYELTRAADKQRKYIYNELNGLKHELPKESYFLSIDICYALRHEILGLYLRCVA